jgi:hypothetical protein
MAASVPVVIASDQSAVPVSGTVTTTPPANASTNVTQFGSNAVVTGTGASGLGIPRVTISNDSALAANQSVNVAQIAGTATVTAAAGVQKVGIVGGTNVSLETTAGVIDHNVKNIANAAVVTAAAGVQKVGIVGNTGTALETTAGVIDGNIKNIANAAVVTAAAGVQKVGIVGNAGAIFDAATGAAVPANGLFIGGRAATANPANATGGNLTGLMVDHAGRQVVTHGQIRELIGIQQTNVAVNTETTIITAGGAGVFNDLVALIITTAGAAAQTITIKDATAGTTRFILNYPNAAIAPGSPLILSLGFAIPQAAANANWTVTQSLATACNYTAVFLKNT